LREWNFQFQLYHNLEVILLPSNYLLSRFPLLNETKTRNSKIMSWLYN
jgi:hypothetical protein